MINIYTYPNNPSTGYINPTWYGSTTGGSETGYYKRILDLKDGTYKAWATGQTAPVDTVSDLITATGKFHKGVQTENGLENIMIYSYYNQPLVTLDSVLINTDVSASDTDASPAVRLTVTNSDDFVDGDQVLLTGFDETLAGINNTNKYVDIINSTTVDLYYDSSLNLPVQYFSQITNQPVPYIDYDAADPTTTNVKVILTGLGSTYSGADATFNNNGSIAQARLNALGNLHVEHTGTGDEYSVFESTPGNSLTISEFMDNNYSTFGDVTYHIEVDDLVNSNNDYQISTTLNLTNQSIFKVQKRGPDGLTYVDGLQNLPGNTSYTANTDSNGDTLVYAYGDNPATDTPISDDKKSSIKLFRKALTKVHGTNEYKYYPGSGYYIKPLYDDTGLHQINTNNRSIVTRLDNSVDSDIELNFATQPTSPVANEFYYYGNSYFDPINPLYHHWFEFSPLFGSVGGYNTQLYKTINSVQYDIQEENFSIPTQDGDTVQTYTGGNSIQECFANIISIKNNAGQQTSSGPARSGFFVGRIDRSDLYWPKSDFYKLCEAIHSNPTYQRDVPYVEITDQNGDVHEVAIFVYKSLYFSNENGQQDWEGFDVGVFNPEAFNNGDLSQPLIISNQSLEITNSIITPPNYSGGNTTGNVTVKSQTRSGNVLRVHTPLTVDQSWNTGYVLNSAYTYTNTVFKIYNTQSLWDVIQTGTIVYDQDPALFPNALQSVIKVYEGDTSSGAYVNHRLFTKHAIGTVPDWANPRVNSGTAIYTQGDNWFTPDTTTDYTYFIEPTTLSGGALNQFNETNSIRWLEMNNANENGTATLGSLNVTDSTTGNIELTGTAWNHKGSNPHIYFPGNQTYKRRTGESTYVNGAEVSDDFYDIDSYVTDDFTTYGIKPTLTVSQSTEGYIDGISLGSTGRITTGQKMLKIDRLGDTYFPPVPTPAELEDVWDTDDEWTSDSDTTPEKVWPDHVTPSSAVINYNSPTLVNNSQSGIKYTRSVGHTKWRLEVTYPPMSAEDFKQFHAIAQAAHGQSTPFYFKLRNKDGVNILWSDFHDNPYNNKTTEPRLKDPITPGDTTMLTEGFLSNEVIAFERGEVFIDGENENGNLHTSLSSTDANIYGEAKIRTPWPFRTAQATGTKIYKDPYWAIVTLGDDNFEYQVDVNNYYYVSVAFDLDSWK